MSQTGSIAGTIYMLLGIDDTSNLPAQIAEIAILAPTTYPLI
ncbi:hypothetical protein [Chamaesiphon sp. VAR_48_metabat_135_sub]|nr:hypothetical protein [Chamaesiphon sp. VAR_48_metabat_135_sub]